MSESNVVRHDRAAITLLCVLVCMYARNTCEDGSFVSVFVP